MNLFDDLDGVDAVKTVSGGKETNVIRRVMPKTAGQQAYLETIRNPRNQLVFCMGPAGTGKTHLACGAAAEAIKAQEQGGFERIICVRPGVGAGDHQGYLPGTAEEKNAPFLRPILIELGRYFTPEDLKRRRGGDQPSIIVEPVDFMRGLTFKRSFIIVDEAQNCTHEQLKMIITRLGKGSKLVINGDESQSDLHPDRRGAFEMFARWWTGHNSVDGVATVAMTAADIVREEFLRRLMERWPGDVGCRIDPHSPFSEN